MALKKLLLTAFVTLLSGYAQIVPEATGSAKRPEKSTAEGGGESIRPFRIDFPQNALDDLKHRLAVTGNDEGPRWVLAKQLRLAKIGGETERPAAIRHHDSLRATN